MSVTTEPWIRIQMKTFTRWANSHLADRKIEIQDITKDLGDGYVLHNLLECLGHEDITPKAKKGAKLPFQRLENIERCLKYVKSKEIKLVAIGPEDIERGNSKLILGLIWTLILRFQIVDVDPNQSVRQALLEWCNSVLNPQGISVSNFTKDWVDGRSFCGLVNALQPDHIDLQTCPSTEANKNLTRAFTDAEELFGFPQVLDAVDVIEHPDELSIMTYVSYFRAYVLQNTAYAPNCTAEGPGLTKAVSFEPATFVVTCRSEENQPATRGGANIRAQLIDATGNVVCNAKVTDNRNGTYDCSYESPVDGNLTLKVMVGNSDIKDSPFHPIVEPGEPDPSLCEAYGDGIASATAGETATFTVVTKDKNGKVLPRGGSNVQATLHDTRGDIPVDIKDNGDGTYTCTYTPEGAQDSKLDVIVSTKAFGTGPVKDSPFTVSVSPGAIDLSLFEWSDIELDPNGNRIVIAGKTDTFTVTAKDKFGNPLTAGGCDVKGVISGPDEPEVNALDRGDGTYEISYTPTKAGNYTLGVNANGTPIGGGRNPFPVLVIAAPPSGANSIAYGPGIESATIGDNNHFTVETRDAFDNPVTMGGADVGGFLEKDGEPPVPVQITDNNDGTYTCTYPGLKKAGNYVLTPTVSGEKVKDSPFALNVLPGLFSLDDTLVEFPEECVASLPGPKISVRDSEGNLRTGGGDKVLATLIPLNDLDVKAKPNPETGSYKVAFPPNSRGDYNVNVKVNGKEAPSGPWKVNVTENPLIPEHEQAVSLLMPNSSSVFRRLLLDCSPAERHKVLKELAILAGNQLSNSSASSSD